MISWFLHVSTTRCTVVVAHTRKSREWPHTCTVHSTPVILTATTLQSLVSVDRSQRPSPAFARHKPRADVCPVEVGANLPMVPRPWNARNPWSERFFSCDRLTVRTDEAKHGEVSTHLGSFGCVLHHASPWCVLPNEAVGGTFGGT